ncbi:hypothetical protein [Cyclobacterium qasimii]|uniref:GLPGLI family protein n=2 Tax=Cyclobacterium qasimii TaxID=1350429 RepID=S7VH45_9BACT|nr:hypothetical protein [Cyclobacterium qasimii]EPR69550.1 hypothetical protein ADICYQ_1335 [Cyclobacterium qasimii M12-11B]GEO21399.1 hypothetical protein CQA01_19330 [Cyclobacterium qasimii]
MKKTALSFLFALLTSISYGQTINTDKYLVFYEQINTSKLYQSINSTYLDYYLEGKTKFGKNDYYTKIREYSWGKTDTSYYREDNKNYYHFDSKVNSESVVLPKKIVMGQEWFEADGSWSYKVIGIDEKLETPTRKYDNLIVLECKQLQDRDKQKSKIYHLYYSKGLGMVGSMNNMQLTSYLLEVKKKTN